MKRHRLAPVFLLAAWIIVLGVTSHGVAAAEEDPSTPFGLRNGKWIDDQLLVGGQPTEAQLEAIAKAGIRSVVNLRGEAEEGSLDEAEDVHGLGLAYLHLPIAGAGDLDEERARRLAEWLAEPEHLPAVVHCASGNRVGALFALKAFYVDDETPDEALAKGQEHGLTSLTEKVKALLDGAP